MPAAKRPKKVTVHVIDRYTETKLYNKLDAIVREWHPWLSDANIVLAWNASWKADVDGNLVLGKLKKASDLERELFQTIKEDGEATLLDAVIMLNEEAWQSLNDVQRTAVLDHCLSQLAVATDENDDPKHDECGRLVYRTRKPDVQEFSDVVQRHGPYLTQIANLVKAANETKRAPLLKIAEG